MPAVSVIVPVHNGELHLRECLDSITAQTLSDLEIIVVDDGSTDSSAAIVDEVAAADPRVRRLSTPASGSAGSARNAGLALASGDYLAFLDGDDRFAPTLLEELHAKAVADNSDIVLTRFRIVDESADDAQSVEWGVRLAHFPRRTPLAPDALGDHLFLAVNPAPWNKLFASAFVARTGLRFQPLRRTNDLSFTALAMAQTERISYITSYGVDYRVGHDTSLQATLHESPLDFVEALSAVRDGLIRIGRWPDLERAFVNLVVEVSLTALRKAGTAESFRVVHDALRTEVLPRFGVTGRPDDYFLRREYPGQLAAIEQRSSTELLFEGLQQAQQRADRTRAELRAALLAIVGPGPDADPTPTAEAPDAPDPGWGSPAEPGTMELSGPAAPGDGSPDVSVIIPVHNTQAYLRACLASVLEQSGVRVEIICADDGSTDGSGRLLSALAGADPRIQVLTLPHGGQSVARNAALARARGRYVCFVDSDDFWRLDGLAELIERADADRLDLLAFDAESVREAGVDERRWRRMATFYRRPGDYREVASGPALLAAMNARRHYRASPCLYLVRRGLLDERGVRFRPGISHEDNLFTFELMLAAERTAHLPLRLYGRRLRPGSIMGTASRAVGARGYFVCAVEMFRLVQGREFDPEIAAQIGAVIHRVLQQARDQAVRLDADLLAQLGRLDTAADAQALHRLLAEAHLDAKFRRPGSAPAAPPAIDIPRIAAGVRRRVRRQLHRLAPRERSTSRKK